MGICEGPSLCYVCHLGTLSLDDIWQRYYAAKGQPRVPADINGLRVADIALRRPHLADLLS